MKAYKFNDFVKQDSELFRILRKLPRPDKDGPWISGGSIWKSIEGQSLDCDLDFFFASPQQREVYMRIIRSVPYVNRILSEKTNGFNTTFDFHIYDNGYNKTVPIQYVSFRYGKNIEEILDSFDFTACQFAYDGETLFVGDNAFEHLKERKIVFHKISDAAATSFHLKKYIDKGFTVSREQDDIFRTHLDKSPKRPVITSKKFDIFDIDDTDNTEDYYPTPIPVNFTTIQMPTFETNFTTPNIRDIIVEPNTANNIFNDPIPDLNAVGWDRLQQLDRIFTTINNTEEPVF